MSLSTSLAQTRTTDGRSAWQKYVVDNKDFSAMTFEIDKDLPSNSSKKLIVKSGGKFSWISTSIKTGDKIKITSNKTTTIKEDWLGKPQECAEVKIDGQSGYIPIRNIKKPTNVQNRVKTGAVAQMKITPYVGKLADQLDLGLVTELSQAKKGSNVADVVVSVSGKKIQIEVKNDSSGKGEVSMYDKTYTRGVGCFGETRDSDTLDGFTQALFPTLSGQRLAFETAIDKFRSGEFTSKSKVKSTEEFGFIGDLGVINRTGKIPLEFSSTDTSILKSIREEILKKLRKGGDDYFAFVQGDTVNMFYTGKSKSDTANVLKLPVYPNLKFFKLDTYGSAPARRLRTKIFIKFDI
jgi:hypothetical protein